MTTLYQQFGNPTGALGALAGTIMAHRPSNRQRNAWTVRQLDLRPDDHVLEIGYGPGLAVRDAAALVPHGRVVGVERSPVMLRQARRRNRRAIAAGLVDLRVGDPADLADETFQKAYAINVFMFWPQPVDTLRRIAALLTPGGRIALTMQPRGTVTADSTDRAATAMSDALAAAGYTGIEVRTLPLEPVPAACVLGVLNRPTR